jgi:aldehyde dehydrogenase (NAD(P)+)
MTFAFFRHCGTSVGKYTRFGQARFMIEPAAYGPDLDALRDGATRWAGLAPAKKARLFAEVRVATAAVAARWTAAAAQAKGIAGTPLEGEEAISGPWAVLYALNRYIRTLDQIATAGRPQIPAKRVRRRADGRTVVDVFPETIYDTLLLNGVHAEVWMQDGVTPANLAESLGPWYAQSNPQPRVALVLGAGNIASIPPLDVLYKLVAGGAVCALKMNPVNDYLRPIFDIALAPLIREGYLRIVEGDAELGARLCADPRVDEIHVTGSRRTHDAILAGLHAAGLEKSLTSELGNVSPTIVVPGDWSDDDFAFQAENIATQKRHNAGFNCIASQVLIVPGDWDGTPKLLAHLRRILGGLAPRPQYYPGAAARHDALTDGRTAIAESTVLVRDDDAALQTEAFCDVLAVHTVPGEIEAYLASAVTFANDRLDGTLGANLIVHPKTERAFAREVDGAIDALRYGCIGVNAWTGVGFLLAETPWGAYPGRTPDDVGSGIGVVHNAHLFSRSLKSVVRAPFAPFPRSLGGYGGTLLPKPPWFVTNGMAARVGEALCAFEARPSPGKAAHIAALAMRG